MKSLKEIELSLVNEPGRLLAVINLLGAAGIRLIAFHVSMRGDEGHLNFVADNPDKAFTLLSAAGHSPETHDVIACEVPHHPGGISAVLKPIKDASINVEHIYPCLSAGERTVLILRAHPVKVVIKHLEEEWIRVFGEEDYSL